MADRPAVNTASTTARFRMVRSFGAGLNLSDSKAYRVESVELMTEQEAMGLMRILGSPYQGKKYDDRPPGG